MKITINWKSWSFGSSHSVSINWDNIMIDGKVISELNGKNIKIEITWDVENLEVEACNTINVSWNIKSCRTSSWDVRVKWSIEWNVNCTSWDIVCGGGIWWDVNTTSGDVGAREIKWRCSTISWDIN
jgi:hypothetical protein